MFPAIPAQMNALDAYLLGEPERGVAALKAVTHADFRDPELRFYLARQAARLGATDAGNDLLRRSVEEGYWSPRTMMCDPWLESLRNTAAFRDTYELAKQRAAQSKTAFLEAGGERVLSEAHR